jgi:uncharacterized protein YndB with AHSA1/START domain
MATQAAPGNHSGITGHASIEINAEPAIVWDALTNPAKVKEYFFGTKLETDWEVGSPVKFSGEYEGKKYVDKGTVLTNDHHNLLQYTYWSSMGGIEDKAENYVTISYKLTSKGASTLLEITQENIPDEKMRKHSEQNWNIVLSQLKDFVEHGSELSTEEGHEGE